MQFTTVVLNLDCRPDRLANVARELEAQNITFERFSGIKRFVGWRGFNQSVKAIFGKYNKVENLLIIEDDCYFESHFDRSVLGDLPEDYDGLWFGANLRSDHTKRHGDRLTQLEDAWCTHAVLYSKRFRDWILENWDGELVFDEWLRVNAFQGRKCFVLRPMIAFQVPNKSDISGEYADYRNAWFWSKRRLK